ncbi:MAG: hypothetical protein JWR21_2502 [Herminiimonas sp.]|nr:hypothetical protein [Herminiimonas sp.]MDB5852280.1 hypothetical protein [Herminiimonas sp.]
MTMSVRECEVWLSMIDAYHAWNKTKHESQMMPLSLLPKYLGRRFEAGEIKAVLDKGVVARLIEIQRGQSGSFFYPLDSPPTQGELFSNQR